MKRVQFTNGMKRNIMKGKFCSMKNKISRIKEMSISNVIYFVALKFRRIANKKTHGGYRRKIISGRGKSRGKAKTTKYPEKMIINWFLIEQVIWIIVMQ